MIFLFVMVCLVFIFYFVVGLTLHQDINDIGERLNKIESTIKDGESNENNGKES